MEEVFVAAAAFGALVFAFGMARYATTSADQVARHPLRRRLVEFVRGAPGARLKDIVGALGWDRATTQYHLVVLERAGAVKATRTPHESRFFPPEFDSEDVGRLAILLRGRVLEVAFKIAEHPGSVQGDITGAIRLSRKVFRAYADLLVGCQLLQEERRGAKEKAYYPTPTLERLLVAIRAKEFYRGADPPESPP